MQQNTCDEALAVALYSERVQTLLRAIKVMGCGALRKGISCRVCDKPDDPYYQGKANTQGYFDSKHRRVVLCCEQIATQKDLEDTLVHELVCRWWACHL
ncbi:hypothetical protein SARC_02369 [Sphaeroforma arctica JP610]|uniref:Mitochondrial inner membrane protease ATP23 n=1 Tax=Sphaeroforma arctica JP610 TaxID=667725 RepID=A0A0L0G8Y7_9EUKA|nr:hypothetical protein SARC_02369 [Sphaeroforma arctica JP610]KNC85465.1 hypothetical protein SARC_02369 [Sphaeroforma arctica JP610]|eukprot:XP_014159367.1 hypothetical protein SARC_02369 [Sphaeroforma arctica JP610]